VENRVSVCELLESGCRSNGVYQICYYVKSHERNGDMLSSKEVFTLHRHMLSHFEACITIINTKIYLHSGKPSAESGH